MKDIAHEPEAGSCLTLNNDLKEIRAALNDARRLLGEAKAAMATRTKDGDGTLVEAFKGAVSAFNAAQSGFNAIENFDRDIKTVIREALPVSYRKHTELTKDSGTVSSLSDEGYARVMVNVRKVADPFERMDALLRLAAKEAKAMKDCDARMDKLGDRAYYYTVTERQSDGSRDDMAKTDVLVQHVRDRKRIHGLRLKAALDLFFSTRMEVMKVVDGASSAMASLVPSDFEPARDASFRYDAMRYLENMKAAEDAFRNPSGLIARTGRRVRRRTYSMPSSLCCSAQTGD